MRRILKAIVSQTSITTIADPSLVDTLLEERYKMNVGYHTIFF